MRLLTPSWHFVAASRQASAFRSAWDGEVPFIRYYHDQLQQATGQTIPFDGTLDECRRQIFSVLKFWTITMNPAPGMPQMQPRDITLEFMRRISTAIDDLDALDSFGK